MAQFILLAKTRKTTLLERRSKAEHFQELSRFLQITQGVLVFLLCPLQAFFPLVFLHLVFHSLFVLPLVVYPLAFCLLVLPQVFYPLVLCPLVLYPLVCHLLVLHPLVYLPLVFFQEETTIPERNSFRSELYF